MIGPSFMQDLPSILVRFRTYPYGISTDIEKAFLHIKLDEADRDYTRFFWLSDTNDTESKLHVYRFKTVLFGAASSPFMLNAVLKFHLDKFDSSVAKNMQQNLYVDNILSGGDTEDEVINYYNVAREIMSQAKFNLRCWATNSTQLHDLTVKENTVDEKVEVNTLGQHWNTASDTLSFGVKNLVSQSPLLITKREILQNSSKIFDPLGLLTPVTIQSKILMQDIWQKGVHWDEPLEEELRDRWIRIGEEMQEATKFTIPRCYSISPTSVQTKTELHVFADASTKAYGAVAYLCAGTQTSFVMARTRVAPLKKVTLPRLELMAAQTAARLAQYIQETLKTRFDNLLVHLWTDSQIVLYWLYSNKQLKQFISNRVKDIQSKFPTTCWSYCPTHTNPADLITRGISAEKLKSSTIWLHGPAWLTTESDWPKWKSAEVLHMQVSEQYTEEVKCQDFKEEISSSKKRGILRVIKAAQYSNLTKLLCVTAFVIRFIGNLKNRSSKQVSPLTPLEISNAEKLWIQHCQISTYSNEIENLQSKLLNRLPLVRQLRLFLDSNKLIRCGGRIHNAPVSDITKFPYLLPANTEFTALVVYATHVQHLHSGVNGTVTALRQKYWIPSARSYVKKLLRHCVTCRKTTGKPYSIPDPPPLQKSRLQDSHPFTVTGVDFTGALYVRSNNEELKAYICLFTCAATRALHLEVVTDLSVETFLLAFRKFASRKSLPKLMISDNASTYSSAADELKELFESIPLQEALAKKGVTWQFIPKRAPWYGGFWERLIGLTKTALKKVLGRRHVTLATLETLVVEIEAVLNDRPLTYIPTEINDLEPLTPAHLLYGRKIVSLPHPTVEEDELIDTDYGNDSEITRRSKTHSLALHQFWTRWKAEYLTSLREFHKTTGKNTEKIKVGDIVQVHGDNKRVNWKLAVVESLIRGNDGHVRAANIRTSKGKTNRPIAKLYPLEINSIQNNNPFTMRYHKYVKQIIRHNAPRETLP